MASCHGLHIKSLRNGFKHELIVVIGVDKKVMFVLPTMRGGGAERVATLLSNEFYKKGIDVSVLLTSAIREEVVIVDLDKDIPIVFLKELPYSKTKYFDKLKKITGHIWSSAMCKTYEALKKPVPAQWAYYSFVSEYGEEINKLRSILVRDSMLTVIAFLQPSIPIALLAARGLKNRVIISERGNPLRLMDHRYGKRFIEKFYTRADNVVFQTEDAKEAYPNCIGRKGVVIPNPIKENLPESYYGERNYNITTFCRISTQKNLPLLFKAFLMLHQEYPDYKLRVIGDALNDEGRVIIEQLKQFVQDNHIEESVIFESFMKDVHRSIIKDAMYVNSSDYEGMSNAMLEAMAIGMPVICTDCPIGGAAQVIADHENGLLVPVNDADALYKAMKNIIEDSLLSLRLSDKARKIGEVLSMERIIEKWQKVCGE